MTSTPPESRVAVIAELSGCRCDRDRPASIQVPGCHWTEVAPQASWLPSEMFCPGRSTTYCGGTLRAISGIWQPCFHLLARHELFLIPAEQIAFWQAVRGSICAEVCSSVQSIVLMYRTTTIVLPYCGPSRGQGGIRISAGSWDKWEYQLWLALCLGLPPVPIRMSKANGNFLGG